MRYLLDFDGVIFNTKALKEKMVELGLPQTERSAQTFDLVISADDSFDVSSLIFDDALGFLKKHGKNCSIISSYMSIDPSKNIDAESQRLYQEAKIHISGVADMIGEKNVHIVGASKAQALSELNKQYKQQGEECIFVDDHLQYVQEAKVLGISTFWMVRDITEHPESMTALADVQRVSSFNELETYLST